MSKRYYNSTTSEWYTEGQTMTRKIDNGMFSGIPSVEQLTAWGFKEWFEPAPTPTQLLEQAKAGKVAEIEAYDGSDAVNAFSVNGKWMWLDAATRQQLRISLDAMKAAGRESVTKWFDGEEYTYPTDVWYYMLGLVEVYASDCLNVTEGHKRAVQALETVEAVESYDYTTGYPEKVIL